MNQIPQLQQLKDNQTIVYQLQNLFAGVIRESFDFEIDPSLIEITTPSDEKFGDYTTNIALKLSKELKKNPREIAESILNHKSEVSNYIDKMEIAGPGFINIYLKQEYFIDSLKNILVQDIAYGKWDLTSAQMMVEFFSPNAFKALSVGHLRNAITGHSVSRLIANLGYEVIHTNYYSDMGMHVAKSIWEYERRGGKPENFDNLTSTEKVNYIVDCYVAANKAFKEDEKAQAEIKEINLKVLNKTDEKLVQIYLELLAVSLVHLSEFASVVGINFHKEYSEAGVVEDAIKIVKENTRKVFIEDQGAVIFEGDKYGLNRYVFLSGQGVPTYSAKDLAIAHKKFADFPELEFAITCTSVEQNDYFKVVIKALEIVNPSFAGKYYHLGYGWILQDNKKASTKLGNVVKAFDYIDESTKYCLNKIADNKEYDEKKSLEIAEKIGLAGLKFLMLSRELHNDINYDPDQFLNPEGFSGPYVMYGYVRANSIIRQAEEKMPNTQYFQFNINEPEMNSYELRLLKLLSIFPTITLEAGKNIEPHKICNYIFELTQALNHFYKENKVLVEDENIRNFRLAITKAVAITLKNGLHLLGIEAIEQM